MIDVKSSQRKFNINIIAFPEKENKSDKKKTIFTGII